MEYFQDGTDEPLALTNDPMLVLDDVVPPYFIGCPEQAVDALVKPGTIEKPFVRTP
jgi:hypothetical protein